MRTQLVMKWIPGLLATTLVALACEKAPSPVAPKRTNFSVQSENNSRITGGGKLEGGRDFATFGLNARPDQGHIEWVQHCLDGATDAATCSLGSFTFHESTIDDYGEDAEPNCRVWSGTGEAKFKDPSQTDGPFDYTAEACDLGHPGRDNDSICLTLEQGNDGGVVYRRGGTLTGGNIQRHEGATGDQATDCVVTTVVPT